MLGDGAIDSDEHRRIAHIVHTGGQKLFVVLVLMMQPDVIYNFCQADQYVSQDNLDSRLPYYSPISKKY